MNSEIVIKNQDGMIIWQGDENLVGVRLWLYCKQFPDEFFRVESVPLEMLLGQEEPS